MSITQARKSVLITGCSPGGIGHSLAREFHSKGLYVIASARNKETITDLAAMGISTISLEVTDASSIAAAKKEIASLTGGKLDLLVNNAGRNYTMPALDVEISEIRTTFETNLFSIMMLTQSLTPLLISAKGLIINIGSVAAIIPYVFGSVYNASKAALHAYSSTLRLELEPFDVRVMVVVTGGVESRIARTKRVLPEGSLYVEIESDFERRVSHSQEGAIGNTDYARGVVREALKAPTRTKKWVWRGNRSALIRFVWIWVGGWVFDWVLPGMFGLRRLGALLRGMERKRG